MKILGLGLYKTGTLSLSHAVSQLGYSTQHGTVRFSNQLKGMIRNGNVRLKKDAYFDLPVLRSNFSWFDRNMDCKFILTTRDEESWVKSVRKQIQRVDSGYFHEFYYQTSLEWRWYKRYYEEAVIKYFKEKDNLLIMRVQEGWDPLCEFLDKPIPKLKFPHKNKS